MVHRLCWLACTCIVGCGDGFETGGGTTTGATTTTTATTTTSGSGAGGAGGGATGTGGAPATCSPLPIADDFENESGLWSPQSTGGVQAELAGGVLRFTAQAGAVGEAAWLAAPQDVHDRCVFVEVADIVLHGPGTVARFVLGGPDGSIAIVVVGGAVHCVVDLDSVTEACNVPHDPGAHRWLRMRSAADRVHFEASPDGAAWSALGDIPGGAFLGALGPVLSLRVPQAAPSDVLVAYDRFDVPP